MIGVFKLTSGETVIAELLRVETHNVNQRDKKFYILKEPRCVVDSHPIKFRQWVPLVLPNEYPVAFEHVMLYVEQDDVDSHLLATYRLWIHDDN